MCNIAARSSANGLKTAIHDIHVDVAVCRMMEGSGETPDNFKAKALPQTDGALVRAEHEIKLQGAKSAFSRPVQGMRAHCSSHTAARRRNRTHVTAIGNVSSAALLVRLQAVGSNEFAGIFGDENFAIGRKPVCERALFVHVARQGIRLAGADDGLHDSPDGGLV